ncbi:MAG: membrane protein insertase YidC [Clostridium sp.]|nr:membrane protein insertase YidC [Clostridium sp.]
MFKIAFLNNLFVQFFQSINKWILSIVPDKNISYGLSIIILTVIIRFALLPLNYKSLKSSFHMTRIAPEVKKLQGKYKENPQKLNEETMKLYKDRGVSPLGGCLPMIIQYPILIALYYVFYSLNIKGIGFLWIHDLSNAASFSDWTSLILPIFSGATTYISGMLMQLGNTDKAQVKQTQSMNLIMSAVFLFMSLKFNAALVLYWTVGNIIQIIQTQIVMSFLSKKEEEAKN